MQNEALEIAEELIPIIKKLRKKLEQLNGQDLEIKIFSGDREVISIPLDVNNLNNHIAGASYVIDQVKNMQQSELKKSEAALQSLFNQKPN